MVHRQHPNPQSSCRVLEEGVQETTRIRKTQQPRHPEPIRQRSLNVGKMRRLHLRIKQVRSSWKYVLLIYRTDVLMVLLKSFFMLLMLGRLLLHQVRMHQVLLLVLLELLLIIQLLLLLPKSRLMLSMLHMLLLNKLLLLWKIHPRRIGIG